jgi:hypothetical protein
MTDAEFNFSYDAKQVGLVVGTHVKVTKIRKDIPSPIEVGHSVTGHICQELQLNVPLYFSEYHNQNITSELRRIFKEEDKTFIETKTSIYEVTFL